MTPEQHQCLDLQSQGMTRAEIAAHTGLSKHQVKRRLAAAKRDPAINKAMDAVGTNMTPSMVWVKTDGHSVMLRPDVESQDIDAIADSAIARVMATNVPTPYVKRAPLTDENKMGFLALFDAHIGLSMPNYGLQQGVDRLLNNSLEMIDEMPTGGEIVILNGGDFTHQNDESNQTPRSKHPLPVDGTYDDATDAGTDALIKIIEHAANKFPVVSHKSLAGNHDPATAKIIRAALYQRYVNVENVNIDIDGTHFYKRKFGKNMITGQHGDIRRSAKDIVLGISNQNAAMFGATTHREHHTGHLHHIKTTRFDDGGITLCQHAAISPASDHDIDNLYKSSSVMQGITYRKSGGRHSCIELSLD